MLQHWEYDQRKDPNPEGMAEPSCVNRPFGSVQLHASGFRRFEPKGGAMMASAAPTKAGNQTRTRKGGLVRLWATRVISLLIALLIGASNLGARPATEYEVKAVFLFNFAKFVEWPSDAFANDSDPLVIGIVGDNPFGARVTGIPSRPIIVLQYILAALIGCFAGFVMVASVNSAPTRIFNSTLIYDVILVVVLGGIGLSGGRGGVLNVVIGTLLIGTMLNGMTIMDVSYSAQNLVKGVVLLAAVIADSFLNPRNEETAQQGDI